MDHYFEINFSQIARALGKIQSCSLKKEASNPLFDQDFFKILAETWPLEVSKIIIALILKKRNSDFPRHVQWNPGT